MYPVWILHRLVIEIDLFIPNLNDVTLNPHNPFDEILLGIFREFEHNDIASFRLCDGNKGRVQERQLYAVDKLVYKDVVSHQQCWFHGAGRDFKGLHNKGPYKKGKNHCNEYRLCIFPKDTLPGSDRSFSFFIFFQCYMIPFQA